MDLQKKRVADGALSGTEKRNLMLEWYLYQMHGDLLLPCFAWKYFWDGMTIFQEVDLDSFFRECLLFFDIKTNYIYYIHANRGVHIRWILVMSP